MKKASSMPEAKKYLITAGGIILALGLLCLAWSNAQPRSPGGEYDFSYIGLTLDDAKDKAAANGNRLRVVAGPQKQKGLLTMEYDENRVNVLVIFNIVIKAQRG